MLISRWTRTFRLSKVTKCDIPDAHSLHREDTEPGAHLEFDDGHGDKTCVVVDVDCATRLRDQLSQQFPNGTRSHVGHTTYHLSQENARRARSLLTELDISTDNGHLLIDLLDLVEFGGPSDQTSPQAVLDRLVQVKGEIRRVRGYHAERS